MKFRALLSLMLLTGVSAFAQKAAPPILGWSSWNNFQVNIDEKMIAEQAEAMVKYGLYDAGYRFINIDDGYFGGRDKDGKLFVNATKFPSGMKVLVDKIHGLKLKAGIYTDAGSNTCGSMYNHDALGVGAGAYGHVEQDANLFFKEWGFDFLKVDWCGGEKQKLNEEQTYVPMIKAAKAINSRITFNICRWKFPGEWAIDKADSWRISGDIQSKFASILSIIDLNADLAKYSSAGHYNDMDMLQVGRGMSYEEDKTHFSMWCMMNSPLLAGNDLRNMSQQTIGILTNKEVIALNQDEGFKQATREYKNNDIEVWIKPLGKDGKAKGIAILNRGKTEQGFDLNAEALKLNERSQLRDLWAHSNLGKLGKLKHFTVPAHGVVVLKVG